MKKIYYTLLGLLISGDAMSQAITLSSSPTINPGKVDSCALPPQTSLAMLSSSLTPATNASWDLSGITLQSTPVIYAYHTKTTGFPAAGFSDSVTYSLGSSSAGASFKAWRNIQQGSGGVTIQGEEILTRQAKNINPLAMCCDSLIIQPQVITYTTALRTLKFPATIGTTWIDSTARNISFTVNSTLLSLSNAPGQLREKRIYIDSVVGWGRTRVPILGKGTSTWMQVLQIQHRDVMIDSFFINGAPATATMLTPLGASQGQSTTTARTFFYRANAYRPLIEMVHSTPSHSSVASTFYIHAIDLEQATAINAVSGTGDIRVYPNPSQGGKLYIDLNGRSNAGWNYTLVNIAGVRLAQGNLPAAIRTAINLPEGLSSGVYYIRLTNPNEQTSILPFSIR